MYLSPHTFHFCVCLIFSFTTSLLSQPSLLFFILLTNSYSRLLRDLNLAVRNLWFKLRIFALESVFCHYKGWSAEFAFLVVLTLVGTQLSRFIK